jgi:prepilin peptidase CpaA
VPNSLTLGITATGVALAAAEASHLTIGASLAGLAIGLVLMLPGHLIGGTGAGDVKLFGALGTLLGPSGIAFAFLYTTIAGGVLALVVAIKRRRLQQTVSQAAALVSTGAANVAQIESHHANNRFAYAPAIALGTMAVALGL